MAPIKIKLTEEELKKIKNITKKGKADCQVSTRALILKFRHLNKGSNEICELLDLLEKLSPIP